MRDGYDTSPLNPVPAAVWLLILPIVAMEVVFVLGGSGFAGGQMGIGWRQDALQRFAFAPEMFRQMVQTGQWNSNYLMRFVTYSFVHVSLTHAVFVCVFILALGKFVSDVFRPWAVLLIFFASGIVAAMAYSLLPGAKAALIGGYPAAYGMIGAFTFILSARLGALNANRARAFVLIGMLLGFQLLLGLIFGSSLDWVADLAGFATGFLLSFLVAPGGPAHLLARIRQR